MSRPKRKVLVIDVDSLLTALSSPIYDEKFDNPMDVVRWLEENADEYYLFRVTIELLDTSQVEEPGQLTPERLVAMID
jgi:hypothetical protein